MTGSAHEFDVEEWLVANDRDGAAAYVVADLDRLNSQIAARGLWALADLHIPPDVREAAARWKLDAVMTEMWRAAFITGFREAVKTIEQDRGHGS